MLATAGSLLPAPKGGVRLPVRQKFYYSESYRSKGSCQAVMRPAGQERLNSLTVRCWPLNAGRQPRNLGERSKMRPASSPCWNADASVLKRGITRILATAGRFSAIPSVIGSILP